MSRPLREYFQKKLNNVEKMDKRKARKSASSPRWSLDAVNKLAPKISEVLKQLDGAVQIDN